MPYFACSPEKGEVPITFRSGTTDEYMEAREQGYILRPSEIGVCFRASDGSLEAMYLGTKDGEDIQIWPIGVDGRFRTELTDGTNESIEPDDETSLNLSKMSTVSASPNLEDVYPKSVVILGGERNPTSEDNTSKGILSPSLWVNTLTSHLFYCKASSESTATWVDLTSGASVRVAQVAATPTITLATNTLTVPTDKLSSTTFALDTAEDGVKNTYECLFSVASDDSTVTWPDDWLWDSTPTLKEGSLYHLSVIANDDTKLCHLTEWENVSS